MSRHRVGPHIDIAASRPQNECSIRKLARVKFCQYVVYDGICLRFAFLIEQWKYGQESYTLGAKLLGAGVRIILHIQPDSVYIDGRE